MKKIIYTALIISFFSCKNENKTNIIQKNDNNETIQYAQNFTIKKHANYSVLQVKNPWDAAKVSFNYVVYDRGGERPDFSEKAVYIQRPVERVACTSTTHLALLNSIGEADKIVGISGAKYVYNADTRERIAAGKVKEIGNEAGLNYEILTDTEPDIVLTYGMSADNNIDKLREAGLTPVVLAEYTDYSPLGRAEWMKFIAVLFDKEAKADSVFHSISTNYNELKKLAKNNTREQPRVMVGMGFSGNWYVPGGASYVANHIEDAGGAYIWQKNKDKSSLQLDFETVYENAQDADKWINMGVVSSAADIVAADERYSEFKALKNRELYNGSRRISPQGGYDIYESAVVQPDIVLKDLIKAFHPELLPEHAFFYYEKLK